MSPFRSGSRLAQPSDNVWAPANIQSRPEIWKYVAADRASSHEGDQLTNSSQIKIIRRSSGNRLFVFAPANDLSMISRSHDVVDGQYGRSSGDGRDRKREVDLQGGRVLGDEWADHVVQNRSGIMLRASSVHAYLSESCC